jgi:hypothetical protein
MTLSAVFDAWPILLVFAAAGAGMGILIDELDGRRPRCQGCTSEKMCDACLDIQSI